MIVEEQQNQDERIDLIDERSLEIAAAMQRMEQCKTAFFDQFP